MQTTIIERIFEAVTAQIQVDNFSFVLGGIVEINNKTDNTPLPIVGLEQDFAMNFVLGASMEIDFSLILYILYSSKLDDMSKERSDYFYKAQKALQEIIVLLESIRYDREDDEFLFNERNKPNKGIKLIKKIMGVSCLRVKNKFAANTDGILVNSLKIRMFDDFNYCGI